MARTPESVKAQGGGRRDGIANAVREPRGMGWSLREMAKGVGGECGAGIG